MSAGERIVAAFDFDGTLTRRDTLLPWLVELCGPMALGRRSAGVVPSMAWAVMGRADRNEVKAALFANVLRGVPLADAERAAETVARRLAVKGMRTPMVDRLRRHLDDGHEVVVVSASSEVMVRAVVAPLGVAADHVVATRLDVDAEGKLTGRMVGLNNRGAEKVARLCAWELATGGPADVRYAYGDSAGDDELLAFAHHSVKV